MKRFTLTLLCLIAAPLARSETPVTDREQALAFQSTELHALAAQAYRTKIEQLRHKQQLDRDAKLVHRTRTIASRLIAQAIKLKPEAASWNWALHVSNSSDVDASSMAGGKLLVGSKFIRSLKLSDDELAILIGHEIGHAIAEHVREEVTAVLLSNPKNPGRSLEDILAEMNSDLSTYFQLMSMSRMQEVEADQIGVRLAAMAGFRPSAALTLKGGTTTCADMPNTSPRTTTLAALEDKLARAQDANQGYLFDTHASPQMRTRIAPALVADSRHFYQHALYARSMPVYAFR